MNTHLNIYTMPPAYKNTEYEMLVNTNGSQENKGTQPSPLGNNPSTIQVILYTYLLVLKKYAVIEGRSGRFEFWVFSICHYVTTLILYFAGKSSVLFIIIGLIYVLATLIPNVALMIRRLHDTGHSVWSLLLYVIPLIGQIVLLIYWITPSDPGRNEYGEYPDLIKIVG